MKTATLEKPQKRTSFELLTLDNVISRRRMLEPQGWHEWDGELTETQRASLLSLFGKGCRKATVDRLRACFADNCRRVKGCGIMKRVVLEELAQEGRESKPNGFQIGYPVEYVSYCAGQDYPSEIALIRRILIASY